MSAAVTAAISVSATTRQNPPNNFAPSAVYLTEPALKNTGAARRCSVVGPARYRIMTDDWWQKIERIYNATWERDPQERSAYLSQACGGDRLLEHEVQSLLSASAEAGHFLSSADLERQVRAVSIQNPPEFLATTIGPYEILSQLGSGGMS
jgi:hypothetical protein